MELLLRAARALSAVTAASAPATPAVAVAPIRCPLLHASDVGVELRSVLRGQCGTRIDPHPLVQRLELRALVRGTRERGAGRSGVATLARRARRLEIWPHRLADRL